MPLADAARTTLLLLAAVYAVVFLAVAVVGLVQEAKVGWGRFKRHGSFFFYMCAMLGWHSVLQVPAVLYYLVCGEKRGCILANYFLQKFHQVVASVMWGPFVVENADRLPPGDEACIYVANHQCSIDMSTGYMFPNNPHLVGVGKSSMLAMPGLGAMCALSGGIFVKRGKKGALAMLVQHGTQALKEGKSIGIFPQGTRRVPKSGKPLLPFKIGAFKLAVESQFPIVPFTIVYPSDFMDSSPKSPGLKMIIHPKVKPGKDPEALMKEVETTVLKPLIESYGALAPEPAPPRNSDKKRD